MTLTLDPSLFATAALSRVGFGQDQDVKVDLLPDIADWAGEYFFIAETRRPVQLMPHQKRILRLMTEQRADGRFIWKTCLYSTIKKSGKTTVSAIYGRWAAETWGAFQEIYNLGNKLKQSKERAYRKVKQSIELSPREIREQWAIQETQMLHLPTGSIIQALPINDAGEAGGNQSLTIWTELWGFEYEEALRMWDELQPVPTRPLSQRFVDTYAGYEGESELLWGLWSLALSGERLDDELPIYGVREAGLIAYIDSGAAARRMPWQCGPDGERYYTEQEKSERPRNYRRLHLNEWVTSQGALFNDAMWDRLVAMRYIPRHGDVIVVGVDASVSGDSTALVVVAINSGHVYELETWTWEPDGEKLDYDETLRPALIDVLHRYSVTSVAYDPYQLHDMMTRLAKDYKRVEFYEFNQGEERIKADTALLTRVRQGTLSHTGNEKLRRAILNADGKEIREDAIRLVKRSQEKKIDPAVALSEASWRGSVLSGEKKRSVISAGATGLYGS